MQDLTSLNTGDSIAVISSTSAWGTWLAKAPLGDILSANEHNSAIVTALQLADSFSQPELCYRKDLAQEVLYAGQVYHWMVKLGDHEMDGQEIPVVGLLSSLDNQPPDWENGTLTASVSSFENERRLWGLASLGVVVALGNAVQRITDSTAAEKPAGADAAGFVVGTNFPATGGAGLVFVGGDHVEAAVPDGDATNLWWEPGELATKARMVLLACQEFQGRLQKYTQGTAAPGGGQAGLLEASRDARTQALEFAEQYRDAMAKAGKYALIGGFLAVFASGGYALYAKSKRKRLPPGRLLGPGKGRGRR